MRLALKIPTHATHTSARPRFFFAYNELTCFMRIHVRLFAAIREALGRESVEMDLAVGATPEDVWSELLRLDERGALSQRRVNLAAAVNRKYTRFDTPLADGDEVVFIPPVSGG